MTTRRNLTFSGKPGRVTIAVVKLNLAGRTFFKVGAAFSFSAARALTSRIPPARPGFSRYSATAIPAAPASRRVLSAVRQAGAKLEVIADDNGRARSVVPGDHAGRAGPEGASAAWRGSPGLGRYRPRRTDGPTATTRKARLFGYTKSPFCSSVTGVCGALLAAAGWRR
jgi:hypothetical protein